MGCTHIYHPSLNDLIALNFDAGNGWLQHVEKLLIIKDVLVAPGGPLQVLTANPARPGREQR